MLIEIKDSPFVIEVVLDYPLINQVRMTLVPKQSMLLTTTCPITTGGNERPIKEWLHTDNGKAAIKKFKLLSSELLMNVGATLENNEEENKFDN